VEVTRVAAKQLGSKIGIGIEGLRHIVISTVAKWSGEISLLYCGWQLGKPYNHPDGRGKGGPLWWLAPPPSRPAGPVGLWVLSIGLYDSDGSVERFILPLSGIITVEGNAV
jgi:hypothetical protein